MGDIIRFSPNTPPKTIDLTTINGYQRRLKDGVIQKADQYDLPDLASEHTSEPIKNMDDINRISRYLIQNRRYRDNMLFIVGINFGLRVSDLVTLRFSHLITEDSVFKDSFAILEQKTANTRSQKKNRHVTINTAVVGAVAMYLENTPDVKLSDYMFKSESNNGYRENAPMHRNSVDRILKGIAKDLGLGNRMATHSMRKTFAYHQMVMSGNDPRKLLLLQKMFGHSSSAQTLDYIGITREEIEEAYQKLNLGSETCNYLVDSTLTEMATA